MVQGRFFFLIGLKERECNTYITREFLGMECFCQKAATMIYNNRKLFAHIDQ